CRVDERLGCGSRLPASAGFDGALLHGPSMRAVANHRLRITVDARTMNRGAYECEIGPIESLKSFPRTTISVAQIFSRRRRGRCARAAAQPTRVPRGLAESGAEDPIRAYRSVAGRARLSAQTTQPALSPALIQESLTMSVARHRSASLKTPDPDRQGLEQ